MGGNPGKVVFDVRSVPEVGSAEAFEQWKVAMAEAYVPQAITPIHSGEFHGRISLVRFGTVDVSTVAAAEQLVRRTPQLIARADPAYLWATVAMSGHGWVEQAGRVGGLSEGGLMFYDSTRPYSARLDQPWCATSVALPLPRVLELTGLSLDRLPTAVQLPPSGPIGVVTQFICGLAQVQQTDPASATVLAEHLTGLIASAILLAAGIKPTDQPAQDLTKEQVLSFIRHNFADPELDLDTIARAGTVSRSTLYRLFESVGGGVAGVLRRKRIAHAQAVLCADPTRSLTQVAMAAGFRSERHFYRVFKDETGLTPGEYRERYI